MDFCTEASNPFNSFYYESDNTGNLVWLPAAAPTFVVGTVIKGRYHVLKTVPHGWLCWDLQTLSEVIINMEPMLEQELNSMRINSIEQQPPQQLDTKPLIKDLNELVRIYPDPVQPGDWLNAHRFKVLQKIGNEHSSSVFLAWDSKKQCNVAIKINRDSVPFKMNAIREIDVFRTIQITDPSSPIQERFVKLYSTFRCDNGHVCMVLEPMDCDLLATLQDLGTGLQLREVKHIVRQLLTALDFLHTRCHYIHTDIKPENILVRHNSKSKWPKQVRKGLKQNCSLQQLFALEYDYDVKLADFGNSLSMHREPESYFHRIQTPPYRAPEAVMGGYYDTSADIWSMACLIFELAAGGYLICPKFDQTFLTDQDLLAQMFGRLGPMPDELRRGVYVDALFDAAGDLKNVFQPYCTIKQTLCDTYCWSERSADAFVAFLTPMMDYDIRKRATAAQCLQHEWLQEEK
ncbi:maker64 [Drosophila busckii]|uniref:non-specific serine/threonine protein kinase n=1 Tax=Drosophila busckii TaxID=30019 RepID=A0A0M3QUX3_DROBS|nr:SRSF protein kinase 1 [Drosophila busckii]ALC41383.1 maker64 [Drosophila busckii]